MKRGKKYSKPIKAIKYCNKNYFHDISSVSLAMSADTDWTLLQLPTF